MVQTITPAGTAAADVDNDRLHPLLARIAAGDRAAFRALYAFMAQRVWRDAVRMLPRPVDARAVTRSTFVEVWHLAGHHANDDGHDLRTWIASVTARRVDDRVRFTCRSQLRDDYDLHTHRELVALLSGPRVTG